MINPCLSTGKNSLHLPVWSLFTPSIVRPTNKHFPSGCCFLIPSFDSDLEQNFSRCDIFSRSAASATTSSPAVHDWQQRLCGMSAVDRKLTGPRSDKGRGPEHIPAITAHCTGTQRPQLPHTVFQNTGVEYEWRINHVTLHICVFIPSRENWKPVLEVKYLKLAGAGYKNTKKSIVDLHPNYF